MVSAIFLGNWWKEDLRHWKPLEGHADKLGELLEAQPPSALILDDYVRFLYGIGSRSLPFALERFAGTLRLAGAQKVLSIANTVFMLEVILRRFVYGRPRLLKEHIELKKAVLVLLDNLVEVGSSAAYCMRDDFVTPIVSGD